MYENESIIFIAKSCRAGRHAISMAIMIIQFCVLAIAGCALDSTSRVDSPTGGIDLMLSMHDSTEADELYHADRKGTIEFGGGMNARLGRTTWKGQLTPEEAGRFRTIIQEQNWFGEKLKSTNAPAGFRYRIEIDSPDGQFKVSLKGENDRVKPMREFLDQVSRRRLKADLEQLPQPSVKNQ